MVRSDRRPRVRMGADDRRDAILAAARAAFAARPYSEVKITEIATAAEASDALVYRYFAGKEALYSELVRLEVADLQERQQAALSELAPDASARDRVRALLIGYLAHIAAAPEVWAMPRRSPGAEPPAVAEIRRTALTEQMDVLHQVLAKAWPDRLSFAIPGFLGFIDAACLHWVERGAPENQRWTLVNTALDALQGAIGDWGG